MGVQRQKTETKIKNRFNFFIEEWENEIKLFFHFCFHYWRLNLANIFKQTQTQFYFFLVLKPISLETKSTAISIKNLKINPKSFSFLFHIQNKIIPQILLNQFLFHIHSQNHSQIYFIYIPTFHHSTNKYILKTHTERSISTNTCRA